MGNRCREMGRDEAKATKNEKTQRRRRKKIVNLFEKVAWAGNEKKKEGALERKKKGLKSGAGTRKRKTR